MDTVTRDRRSLIMSRVKAKDTKPELIVRKLLHFAGIRFRLHRADLPGRPDIVLPKHATVIFVHGCFWHRHPRCRKATTPASNAYFWQEKFRANKGRDRRNTTALKHQGWKVIVVWECETGNPEALRRRLLRQIAAQP
jgi:DNA mismatch endonuclease (patch repair protein)